MYNYNSFLSIEDYMKLSSQLYTILKRVNDPRIILMYMPEHIVNDPPYGDYFLEDLYTKYELIMGGGSSEAFIKKYNDDIDKYNEDENRFGQINGFIFIEYIGPHASLPPPKIEYI